MLVHSILRFGTLGILASILPITVNAGVSDAASGVFDSKPGGDAVPNQGPLGGNPAGAVTDALGGGAGGDLLGQLTGAGGLLGGLRFTDLSNILNIDWKNNKQLLGLGGKQDDAKITLLAQKKAKEKGTTPEAEKENIKKEMLQDAQEAHEKAEKDRIMGRLNAFHAYGMQSVEQVVRPKWTMLFDNAFTADEYFRQVITDYAAYYNQSRQGCVPRPHPQIFIFPHGVGPANLEPVRNYGNYTGKLFFNPVNEASMQLPALPIQDKYGYVVQKSA
ncbi:hypothetical protein PENARI_c005G03691 [Penicillium arizonense]|uniref:Uncharacterized protein n=1 Tax=Penicillium arizonense TaxID=1835702 RepID=A0A1F5LPN2_PENAI|nr:hypothetical protein PENARI_c005G03691 [Penicillium arizonense]OGE55056.1 hypothetical protein PENARI_c005G03691 [Penicillium arizonense]